LEAVGIETKMPEDPQASPIPREGVDGHPLAQLCFVKRNAERKIGYQIEKYLFISNSMLVFTRP